MDQDQATGVEEGATGIEEGVTGIEEDVNVEPVRLRTFSPKGQEYDYELVNKNYQELTHHCDHLENLVKSEASYNAVQADYAAWLSEYELYLERHVNHLRRLPSSERQKYLTIFRQRDDRMIAFRCLVDDYVFALKRKTEKPYERAESAVSTNSNVSSKRLKEEENKIELQVKLQANKQKRQLEIRKLQIKQEEEELDIATNLEVAKAKAEVYDKFEQLCLGQSVNDKTQGAHGYDFKQFSSNLNPDAKVFQINALKQKSEHQQSYSESASIQSIVQHLRKPIPDIRKFGGNPLEYRRFVRQFQSKIVENSNTEDEKMNYLEQFTFGEAHKVVSGFGHMTGEKAYSMAREQLEERYGDDEVIATAFIRKALDWSEIKGGDAKGIDEFALFLVECENAADSIHQGSVLNYKENIKKLMCKLPFHLHDRWRNVVWRSKEKCLPVTFSDFVRFVKTEARKMNDQTFGYAAINTSVKTQNVNSDRRPVNTKHSYTHTHRQGIAAIAGLKHETTEHPVEFCTFCSNNSHSLDKCKAVMDVTLDKRIEHVKNNALCFGCLKKGHMSRRCRNRLTCGICQKRHPTIIHNDSYRVYSNQNDCSKTNVGTREVSLVGTCTSYETDNDVSCAMAIIPVKVKLKGKPKEIETYAFFDSGSSVSFCTENVKHQLGASGKRMQITLDTMGNQHRMNTYAIDGLHVCDLNMENIVTLPKVYTKDKLPVSDEHIPKYDEIRKWPHLSNVSLPQIDTSIGIMIGNNVPDAYTPFDVATGPSGSPHATKTRLGWIVWNITREVTGITDVVNRACITRIEENNMLENLVQKSTMLDFPERIIDDKAEDSIEDKHFMKQVKDSIVQENGHFCIDLPFRANDIKLPDNLNQGTQRLKGLKKKLDKNPKFRSDYKTFMDKVISEGYAEIVPKDQLNRDDGKVGYLPHHGIYHPKKPDKLRVVFDCSAEYAGVSLNKQLLQGPDLANNLIGVLIRFREEKVAILGDIEAMFHQVKVPLKDRDCLRFLWWPNGNTETEPDVYRMTVHLFGATSSPSCCNFAIKETAKTFGNTFAPHVSDTLSKDLYVDDCLTCVESEDKAVQLIKDLGKLCDMGGFHMTKWTSNNLTVVASVPESERAKEIKNFDSEHQTERALGVYWYIETDQFGFMMNDTGRQATKKNILSLVSSVYDPIGIMSPFTLVAKSFLQELCRKKLDWDEEIHTDDMRKWNLWLEQLSDIDKIKIDRCYKPMTFGNVISCQLHCFADASDKGYGMVFYLRLVDDCDTIHCAFILGKSRVTPLKSITIPRLELTAAARAVKLSKIITDELSYKVDKIMFWTDSMTVLRYISNENTRFHTFVANRLAIIHEATTKQQWNYVNTKINPADCASRGMTIASYEKNPQWLRGPDFLWKNEIDWPKCDEDRAIPSDDIEVKGSVKVVATTLTCDVIERLITSFSNWMKLKKVTGWLLKAIENLRNNVMVKRESTNENKDKKSNTQQATKCSVFLTVDILNKSETALIRYEQRKYFAEEYDKLMILQNEGKSTSTCTLKKSSKLYKLDPFIDQNGLLRVGGRLERADITYDAKHPMILPKDSPVSKLIMEDIHKSVGHLGKNTMMAALRQKYWILGAGKSIKGIASKCVTCRKYQGQCSEQKMAHLPSERLVPDEPPFTRIGMDFFGPFEIKRGRSLVKRYGVIFTCLATRAVHLEIAFSLDTDSCIDAIRRFISRRGKPTFIRSDNGTNLVSAEKVLREEINKWITDKIHEFMIQKGIQWEFNPPSGSHFGGVWERLIRSVRKVMHSVMHEQNVRLDDESLLTLFCEIEAILNARPLTEVSGDVNDLQVLTPNHLLLLRAGEIMPPGTFCERDNYVRRRWRQVQYLADIFWLRWKQEYLPLLQARQKWSKQAKNIKVGDLVLIADNTPRNQWSLGRVIEVMGDKHGIVRIVKVKTASSILTRPVAKLCVILEGDTE